MHVYIHTSGMQEALHNWGEGHNNLSGYICMEKNYISMGSVIVKLHRACAPCLLIALPSYVHDHIALHAIKSVTKASLAI